MGLVQRIFGGGKADAPPAPRAQVGTVGGEAFYSLNDPAFLEMVRAGAMGGAVSVEKAMRIPAVFRSVMLISTAIGMLPLHLKVNATKANATEHPLFALLHREPNKFQSSFDFRSLMQTRALTKGNAYALIVRSRDVVARRDKIIALVPLDPDRVTPKLDEGSWTVTYEYQPATGARRVYSARDIFHLRGPSMDGLSGISLVKQAADAIQLAIFADLAVRNLFTKGSFVGGVLSTKDELSPEAFDRLRASWNEDHTGAGNAGTTPLLEGGTEYKPIGASAKDSQSNETRGRQVEEIARIFGVPRPLLMVDETSWGSGIDALGQFFVRYALNPWFEAWQQAIERSLLEGDEKSTLSAKFNAGALIRGSMKDQGDYFAKALGAGGAKGWMTQNEVRALQDMPDHEDGDGLDNPMMGQPVPEPEPDETKPTPKPSPKKEDDDE
jgi:HK97 family phage portal protein